MLNWFQNLLMWLCLAGLGGIAVVMFLEKVLPSIIRGTEAHFRRWRRLGVIGMLVTGLFLFAEIEYGGSKPGGDDDDGGGTNDVQMAGVQGRMGRMENEQWKMGNDGLEGNVGFHGEGHRALGVNGPGLAGECCFSPEEFVGNLERTLTAAEYAAGIALSSIGTNEVFDFSAPDGAEICEDWLAFGASTDWFLTRFGQSLGGQSSSTASAPRASDNDGNCGWSFLFGTNAVDALTVFSYGKAIPDMRDTSTFIAPFRTALGIVPRQNWPLLSSNLQPSTSDLQPSLYWQQLTPSNTFVMTWQNALLNRNASTPVSFQAEFWPEGGIVFRYDLSNAECVMENGKWWVTNVVVGIMNNGSGTVFDRLSRDTTSLRWTRLTDDDIANADRDGDGLATADEILIHHTDPDRYDTDMDGVSDGDEIANGTDPLCRDSDGDGLVDGSDPDPRHATSLDDLDGDGFPDAYEVHWFGGTNAVDVASARDATGFTPAMKILGGINPTNAAAAAEVVFTNSLVAWKLFDAFALDLPSGATNLVWERTFTVSRSSAWQQLFVSSSPSDASSWCLGGAVLEWETDTGSAGAERTSPCRDSYRIPLSQNDRVSTITLRVRAQDGGFVSSPTSLHLIAYAPGFRLEGGQTVTGVSGKTFHVFTEGSDSVIRLAIDETLRPHRAPPGADERDMAPLEDMALEDGGCSFEGDSSGGIIYAPRPGIYELPDFALDVPAGSRSGGGCTIVVLDPSVKWACNGHGCGYDGLVYDWTNGWYHEESAYPLDTKCLRKKWYRDWNGGWHHDACELTVSSGLGDGDGPVSASVDGTCGTVSVDGVAVWSGTAEHVYDGRGCGGYSEEFLGDGCDSCDTDCADGNCDSLEGPSLGSLKFRIPLGAPVKGQIAGFVWFATETPIRLSTSTFQLLAHPDAHVSDTVENGVRRIVCTDSRGRDLRIEGIADGVRVTIYETLGQKLEHRWELVNVNGSASRIRLRKISRQENVMSDETYACEDGDWTRFDSIAGVETRLTVYSDFSDCGDGGRYETRTMTDADGKVLSSVTAEWSRIGECDNAVLRETYREESTGRGYRWSRADYWNDPAHANRHGQPRLVRGNARSWVYTDYDVLGHETLRVEQRDGSPVPAAFFSNSWIDPSDILHSAFSIFHSYSAFVTMREYVPLSGDSCHENDAPRPRTETRYVVENGEARVIGRTWHRYTRLTRDGYAAIRHETWRACAQNAVRGDAGNAYSYEISFDDAGEGTPLLMRGAEIESLDEDGVLTQNTYALAGGVLSSTSRRLGPSCQSQRTQFPTYEVVASDDRYGTVLRCTTRLTADDTVIADELNVYDEKNRLRSTSYLDGTSLTNAYSCCRLLWSEDREGRRTLRSALTGSDRLYNATEDVWLGEIENGKWRMENGGGTNTGFKVTQHYYDALGRETNTIVGVSCVPGSSASPTSTLHSSFSIFHSSFPCGGSDYSITTDERGKVTVRRTDIVEGGIETGETVFTNGVEVVRSKSRSYFGGGSSTRREWDGDRFTEERRFDGYLADGRRVGYVVAESSDYGVVTSSVTTCDFLGRVVSSAVPGANGSVMKTTHMYDGSTGRKLSSSTTGSPAVTYAYDALGELVLTTQGGRSVGNVTTYETVSGEVFRVATSTRMTGSVTNSVQRQMRQLTGLSDGLLARTVSVSPSGRETVSTRSHNVETGLTTDIVSKDGNTPLTAISRLGLPIEESSRNGRSETLYDAFGRSVSVVTSEPASGTTNRIDRMEYDSSGNVVRTISDFQDGRVAVSTAEYDMLNRNIASTDALGHVRTTDYDSLNRSVFTGGDAYPIQTGYDTAGRKTASRTTRDNGVTWDETTWEYDAANGLNTAKEYADGSRIAYAYTDNGRRTRTTWARGVWKQHAYNDRNLVSATTYSDATPSVSYAYADSGKVESATLAGGSSCVYAYDEHLRNTNEVVTIDGDAFAVMRTYDDNWRASETSVIVTNVPHAAKTRLYDSEDRVCGYALTNSAGRGLSVSLSYDGSYLTNMFYTLPGGGRFSAQLTREPARKELVTNRAYSFNGRPIYSYSTDYDLIGRPTNAVDSLTSVREWLYNRRSELVAAQIGTNRYDYSYDTIGNRLWSSANVATNTYQANNLNQYTCINRAIEQSEQSNNLSYDADGNLTNDGRFTYAYDAENRLVSVYPIAPADGSLAVENAYDHKHRRIRKVVKCYDGTDWRTNETRTFIWDGMNIALEKIVFAGGAERVCEYFWGLDKSSTEQGAGGVGGLLAVSVDGSFYIPCYDHNGNAICYVSESGSIAGQYVYDPYGNIIEQYGSTPALFSFGFSTKYHDREIGMVGYQRRFYRPDLGRWLNRDPIEEDGGENLYAFCGNSPVLYYDMLGMSFWDDLIDSAKVAVGLCGIVSGTILGATTSWTGAGAVGGFAMVAIGFDQVMEGVHSIHSRVTGGPATDTSPIKEFISYSSSAVTGSRNSKLEQYALSAYSGVQLASSCYGGFVAVQGVVQVVRMTYVPAKTIRVMTIEKNVIRYSWKLRAGYWKLQGGAEAAQNVFEISVDGMTYFEHDSENSDVRGDNDVNH